MAWYVKYVDQGFALLCPAQGYPAPVFRYYNCYLVEPINSKSTLVVTIIRSLAPHKDTLV